MKLAKEISYAFIDSIPMGVGQVTIKKDEKNKPVESSICYMNSKLKSILKIDDLEDIKNLFPRLLIESKISLEIQLQEIINHLEQNPSFSREITLKGHLYEIYLFKSEEGLIEFWIEEKTEKSKLMDELEVIEERFKLLTEYTSDVIWIYNITLGQYTYVSPSIYQLRGIGVEEAMQEPFEKSIEKNSLRKLRASINRNIEFFKRNPHQMTSYIDEIQQIHRDGHLIWVELSKKYRYNENYEIELIGSSRNIDDRKKQQEEVVYLSYHDQLTGLFNRRYYEEELKRIDTQRQLPISLLMADVNGLKLANDAFGHEVGDKLLRKVAEILKNESREEDIIARIGGDEFIILLAQTSKEESIALSQRIKDKMNRTVIEGIQLSVSFGCATKTNKKQAFEGIFAKAENDMYSHKLIESKSMKSQTVKMITKSLLEKDLYEEQHSICVSEFCQIIGSALELSANEIQDLGLLGRLHDIGKIAIDENILKKEMPLTAQEIKELQRHPEVGYQILRSVSEFAHLADYVLCHHEKYDGSGYPRRLSGEDIPFLSRILSVAEAYCAMIQDKHYGNRKTREEAIEELIAESGRQFDPAVIELVEKLYKANII